MLIWDIIIYERTNMKLLRYVLTFLLLSIVPIISSAQFTAQQEKQFAKDAEKEAELLKEEGWKVPAGCLPMERQLALAYELQADLDMKRQPKYIFGQAISGGSFYDAAKMQALELAKVELASNILTDLTAIVKSKITNQQLSPDRSNSASEIIKEVESVVSQKLYFPIPLVEIYRTTKDGITEVQIRLAYDKEEGLKAGLDALREKYEIEEVDL